MPLDEGNKVPEAFGDAFKTPTEIDWSNWKPRNLWEGVPRWRRALIRLRWKWESRHERERDV